MAKIEVRIGDDFAFRVSFKSTGEAYDMTDWSIAAWLVYETPCGTSMITDMDFEWLDQSQGRGRAVLLSDETEQLISIYDYQLQVQATSPLGVKVSSQPVALVLRN